MGILDALGALAGAALDIAGSVADAVVDGGSSSNSDSSSSSSDNDPVGNSSADDYCPPGGFDD